MRQLNYVYFATFFRVFDDNFNYCSVACGLAHSMVVVDRANVCDRLDQVESLLSCARAI